MAATHIFEPTSNLSCSLCWLFILSQHPSCPGYWCRLWLAYMHVVLLAVDLLRMHNNKPYFKDTKCEAGFFKILDKSVAPEVAREPANLSEEFLEHTASVRKSVDVLADKASDAPIEFTDLHDASDRDLYTLAALLATLLLKHRMIEEGVLQAGHAAAAPEPAAGPAPAAAAGGGAAAGGAAPAAAAVRTPTKDPVAAAAGRAAAAAADAAASAATAASVAQAATRQLVARQGGRELALAAMLPAPPRYTLGVVTDKVNFKFGILEWVHVAQLCICKHKQTVDMLPQGLVPRV